MKASVKQGIRIEAMVLSGLILVLAASSVVLLQKTAARTDRLALKNWMIPQTERAAAAMDFQALEAASYAAANPHQSNDIQRGLFVSELRVVAIGSAYPIPYEAEICPFSSIPQPAMNQLDRDGDGITDDWELRYGLDKYNAADALLDLDEDGFSNVEEFNAGSDPKNSAAHPPYAKKLRFVKRQDVPFPLVFKGVTQFSDGTTVFQLNTPADGLTHFVSIGEEVQGIVLQQYIPENDSELPRLFVMRGSVEIELVRGEVSADPESKAELINILDRSPIIATMGVLLSLYNDVYAVVGVYSDKVVIRNIETGDVFDIIGLAEGE